MKTRIGTVALTVLESHGKIAISQNDVTLLDEIANAVGCSSAKNAHRSVLDVLERDTRFLKQFTRVILDGEHQTRRVQLFVCAEGMIGPEAVVHINLKRRA